MLFITVPKAVVLGGTTVFITSVLQGKESKTKPSDISMATVTPLVQCSFESIFLDQMSSTEKVFGLQTCINELSLLSKRLIL